MDSSNKPQNTVSSVPYRLAHVFVWMGKFLECTVIFWQHSMGSSATTQNPEYSVFLRLSYVFCIDEVSYRMTPHTLEAYNGPISCNLTPCTQRLSLLGSCCHTAGGCSRSTLIHCQYAIAESKKFNSAHIQAHLPQLWPWYVERDVFVLGRGHFTGNQYWELSKTEPISKESTWNQVHFPVFKVFGNWRLIKLNWTLSPKSFGNWSST